MLYRLGFVLPVVFRRANECLQSKRYVKIIVSSPPFLNDGVAISYYPRASALMFEVHFLSRFLELVRKAQDNE